MKLIARLIALGLTLSLVTLTAAAHARGWGSVHKYVHRSGRCAGQEVLASYYWTGRHTASGEPFDANGNTAAARTWALGTTLTVSNPQNGRSLSVRINDRGPFGIAYAKGARLDLARGAARRLGHARHAICVRELTIRPHPEERREAARLEGWGRPHASRRPPEPAIGPRFARTRWAGSSA